MLTFDQAMILTRTIGSHTTFEDPECEAYFNILMTLPADSQIVEVGLEYGRSSSIALQVAKERKLKYCGIEISMKEEWFTKLWNIAHCAEARFYLYHGESSHLTPLIGRIDAILIDGDHSYLSVLKDCEHFLPQVFAGGYAMFHDYHRESIPDVTNAVNDYVGIRPEWKFMEKESAGTLGIFRRVL
jgi:Methyltransferase domain